MDYLYFFLNIHKPSSLIRSVLNEPQFPGWEEHAIDMPHQIGVLGNFTAVYADFPFVFKNQGFDRHFAVAVFRFRCNLRVVGADTNELFIVADTERRARTQIENGFGAVGFPLRIFSEKDVKTVGKFENFVFVISKILKE